MITAHIGETRDGMALAELRDGDKIIAKLYANRDETKIRIVLSELRNYKQTLISPDNRMVEFTRSSK